MEGAALLTAPKPRRRQAGALKFGAPVRLCSGQAARALQRCDMLLEMAITSINPTTGEKLKEFSPFDDGEIDKRLKQAESAFLRHRHEPIPKRAVSLMAVASLLDGEKKKLAHIITLEMGKLLRAAEEEVEKCARGCRFYAENAERFLED